MCASCHGADFRVGTATSLTQSLLVAALGPQELHLLRMDGDKSIGGELLFKGFGRIRDVVVGPDGLPMMLRAPGSDVLDDLDAVRGDR